MAAGTEKMDQQLILHVYLQAKLDVAERELAGAKELYALEQNSWTHGRIRWCENQLAVINQLLRDAENPQAVIRNYRKRLMRKRYNK